MAFTGKQAAAVALVLVGCATMPERDAFNLCTRGTDVVTHPAEVVRHCTVAIDSGHFSGKDLPAAFNSRGVGHMNLGDFGPSIADFDAAVRLTPDDANPLLNRAIALRGAGNFDRAWEDAAATIALSPTRTSNAFVLLGTIRFAQGRLEDAAEHFAEANRRHPAPFTAVWLHATRTRLGSNARDALLDANTGLPATRWPAPIVNFQLGNLDASRLIDIAAKRSPAEACGARFFVAEKYLSDGEVRLARGLLEEARGKCEPPSAIRVAVDAELGRLAK